MCSYFPDIYPVWALGGSIVWWLVILVLVLVVAIIQPIYVWSRRYEDMGRRSTARWFSIALFVVAWIVLFNVRAPLEVFAGAIVAAFFFAIACSVAVVYSRESVGRRIWTIAAFFGVFALVGIFGWYFGMDLCGTEPFPEYFVGDGVSWDELDQQLSSLESGRVAEFTALSSLGCEACPAGSRGSYVAYRCDELEVKRIGGRYLYLEDLIDYPEYGSGLVNVTYDQDSDLIVIDGSCPLEYVEFDTR